ncbi:hypothetical protein GWI33_022906 [Rhynchophorus ferrugineus]|uniref:Helicase POLQ-like n=2 Tax=Rhynchophorus ferrugineus TaxID=354439 RepID=A0A834MKV6_RHYFE|nr:hypothetical protein GWI33_022906 [Rhynchophorus ferrugineus]
MSIKSQFKHSKNNIRKALFFIKRLICGKKLKVTNSLSEIYKTNSNKSNEDNLNKIGKTQSNNLISVAAFQDEFSQTFNTQAIKQIDSVIYNTKESNEIKNEQSISTANNSTICSKQINDRSLLFRDTNITNRYKQEVVNIFEQIEQSISTFGTEYHEQTIPDRILDVFFADDILQSPEKSDLNPQAYEEKIHEKVNESLANIDWKDESFFNIANCSFGSVIKQALLNNATKNVQPQKVLDCSLNISYSELDCKFKKLGNFYDLPDKIRELIKEYKGIDKLYEWQDECLKLAISNRKNLIYSLPTSGGKTLVAEILMLREVLCYQKNAIFILPYVAIVQEKVWEFSPFGVALDFLVEEYASSKGIYPPRKRRRKHSVYIATMEKALGLINSLIETGRLQEIGLVVIDELHLIGEEGRGGVLETLLTKLMFLKVVANIQIIGMSATIGNIQEICLFLNAEVYTKDFRPVDLIEYVKCGNEIAKIDWKCKSEDDLLTDIKKMDYKYSEAVSKLDPDMIAGLALEVVPKDSCLIFCPTKKNCENVVNLLSKMAKPNLRNHKKVEKDELLNALKNEAGELCDILRVSVPFGLAYHHSGLTNDERRLLEDAFRAGTISIICCTSTLAAGVNLPARRVILRSPYVGKDFISLSKYKQMAGRAGRAGYGENGESIIVTQSADLPKVKALLMSPMNQAISTLHDLDGKGLRHLLLSCISLGIANTRLQLQNVSKSTLMAVQENKLNIDIKKLTDTVIKNLFKLGALEESCAKGKESTAICNISVKMDTSTIQNIEESPPVGTSNMVNKKPKKTVVLTNNTKLVVSNLGCAAIKGGLELCRAHQLYNDLYDAQKSLVLLNCLHLLYLVTPYETSSQIRPNIQVYYDVLTHLDEKELQTARVLGFDDGTIIKMATGQVSKQVPEDVQNRFYVTLMLYDLWKEVPVFKVSEKFQINRGIVQNLMTISATFASNVVNFCDQLEEFWSFSYLLKGMSQRLSHCCVRELLPLMDLPSVKQSRAKQLFNAGYKNLQSIAKASVNELVESIEFMPRRIASQLIAASKMLLLEKVENLREEAEDVLDGIDDPKKLLDIPSVK